MPPFCPIDLCYVNSFTADGDSVTQGPPAGTAAATYPALASNIARRPKLVNVAVSGQTCNTMQANFNSVVLPNFNAAFTHNFASLLCGYNDALSSPPPATIYAFMSSWVTKCLAGSFTCIVGTMTDTDRYSEADRATLNGLITGGAGGGGYTVADFGADATMGCNGCDANTTYFSDKTHPTEAGQVILGNIIAAVLTSLGD